MLELVLFAGLSGISGGYLIYDFLLKEFFLPDEGENVRSEEKSKRKTLLKIEYRDGDKISIANDCGICMDTLSGIVLTTECKHEFHFKCFSDWFKRKNTCPFCRSVVTMT
ncbi:RING-H2 finger protein ATL52-like [Harmonia axyridis]|uniref:RING-H2 finger protein ATL52-like n=1 Tax=Harmonia axyridis TaxID=115357 RepID=UPI001E279CDD|nr:RING-H2 finger protein ATL52-like [Harmonia axyridis]